MRFDAAPLLLITAYFIYLLIRQMIHEHKKRNNDSEMETGK